MKLSLVQMNVKKGSPEENIAHAVSMIERAISSEPDVIMLPEMWNTGYSLENIRDVADNMGEMVSKVIGGMAEKNSVNIVAGSVSNINGRDVFNTMFIFDRKGRQVARYNKIHLFRLMDEHRYLSAGNSLSLFQLEGTNCGGMICYDIRFPELARLMALRGAGLLFIPAQWPHPRMDHWRTLLKARAVENQFFVAGCNRVGSDGDVHFFGHSMVVDPWGEIVGELTDEKENILEVQIDMDLVDRTREAVPVFGDRKPGVYECSFSAEFQNDLNMDLDGGLELNIP